MSPYDSPDYHALIRGIRQIDRDGGDSTLARLVTADWMEERGEGRRAGYVRERCEPRLRWFCEHLSLRSLRESGNFPCLPVDVGNEAFDGCLVVGGFLDSVFCPLEWWLNNGPDICRRHPVREVMITAKEPFSHGTGYSWTDDGYYLTDGSPVRSWDVPPAVYAFIPEQRGLASRHFDSRDSALAALNAAAIRWAEHEADTTPEG